MKIKFDMIGLFVNDLPAMVHFYNKIIGIDIEWNGEGPYAEFKHDGIRFAMYERKMLPELLGQRPSFPTGLNGTFELAINVDDVFKRLIENGETEVYAPRYAWPAIYNHGYTAYCHSGSFSQSSGWMEKVESKNRALYYLILLDDSFIISMAIRENEKELFLSEKNMRIIKM